MARKGTQKTKRCTKSGKVLPATTEFFYRDKSQKDGLSPWSKEAEREYNKAYRAGLAVAKVTRKKDIPVTSRSGKVRLTKFEKTMAPERVERGRAVNKAKKVVVKKASDKKVKRQKVAA